MFAKIFQQYHNEKIWFWWIFRFKTARKWKWARYLDEFFILHFFFQKLMLSVCGFLRRQTSFLICSCTLCYCLVSIIYWKTDFFYFCPFKYFFDINFWMDCPHSEKIILIFFYYFCTWTQYIPWHGMYFHKC